MFFVMMLVLIIAFIIAVYCLYAYVFCNPVKKRPDVYDIPESNLYKTYRNRMSEAIEDMGKMPYEDVSIVSLDGYRLYGKLYIIKADAPLMIFFHGYHGVAEWDGYGFFKICRRKGLNILMVDERAHGKSEGNSITFGIKERYDCKLWTEYVVRRFGKEQDIILGGVSMGAVTVMMSAELGLPENVKAILSDCGYSEPAAIIKETIRKMKLPVKPIYFLVKMGARIFGHFNLEETTTVKAIGEVQIPTLFIHGKQDSIVPVSMCKELYESCGAKKECILIEGADHANSAMTDYETYEKAVMGFISTKTTAKMSKDAKILTCHILAENI